MFSVSIQLCETSAVYLTKKQDHKKCIQRSLLYIQKVHHAINLNFKPIAIKVDKKSAHASLTDIQRSSSIKKGCQEMVVPRCLDDKALFIKVVRIA